MQGITLIFVVQQGTNYMAKTYKIELTERQLETLSDIFHNYKDIYRGCESVIRPAMKIEAAMVKQTGGMYYPDTTYDIK